MSSLFFKSTPARLLAVSLLSLTGAAQAVTVTLSSTWDTTNLSGVSNASTFTSVGSLAADASMSWNTATDIGVTHTFTFTNPFSVSVQGAAPSLANFLTTTPAYFTGAGTVLPIGLPFGVPVFGQGVTVENLGANAKITFTNQGTVLFTSVAGANTYKWSAHFLAQPGAMTPFNAGTANYTLPSAQMDVTLLSAVPETGTAAMLALGLAPVLLAMRRRRNS